MRPQDSSPPSGGASAAIREAAEDIGDVGAWDLVRTFVDQVLVQNARARDGESRSDDRQVDWAAIEVSVSGCHSLEQAIGRAVVIADQMCRGAFEHTRSVVVQPATPLRDAFTFSGREDDPFFAFSMADAVADFGDESRYRTKVARKVARALRVQRTILGPSVAS